MKKAIEENFRRVCECRPCVRSRRFKEVLDKIKDEGDKEFLKSLYGSLQDTEVEQDLNEMLIKSQKKIIFEFEKKYPDDDIFKMEGNQITEGE